MEAEINQDLSTWLEIFKKSDDRRNFPVLVEGVQLFVNKHALAAASPVFEKALFGNFKEAQENQLKLPEKKLSEILELFACLLTVAGHCRKEVCHTNFISLWKLGEEYFIEVKGPRKLFFDVIQSTFQDVILLCEAYLVRQLDFNIRSAVNLADLFKSGVVRHVFSVDRLDKYRKSMMYMIACASFRDWVEFLDELPREVLVEVFKIRDAYTNIRLYQCSSCRCDARFYDSKNSENWCLSCKKHVQ